MRCDAARVGEIFRNLITNALKYNDKPQKWIAIGCVGPGRTIVKKIAQRHSGRIWVESTPGRGITFYWTLDADHDQPTSAHSAGRRQS